MNFNFDVEGRIKITHSDLLAAISQDACKLVDSVLLRVTPAAFKTREDYNQFSAEIASRLHVHPQCIVLRGSALLGFSIAPRTGKAWRDFDDKSDLDVAIVDAQIFDRLDADVQDWERRQGPSFSKEKRDLDRVRLRRHSCLYDQHFPPSTCQGHLSALKSFKTKKYLGNQHRISCFIFRNWWALRDRFVYDLNELDLAVKNEQILIP